MKAFYCDHFVLPLPPTHSFPMLKYRKLRERVIADGILDPGDLVSRVPLRWTSSCSRTMRHTLLT